MLDVLKTTAKMCPHHMMARESTDGIFWTIYGLIRLVRPSRFVELGTYTGHTSLFAVQALSDNEHGEFVGYDVESGYLEQARDRILSVRPSANFNLVCQNVIQLEDKSIACDMAFIDIEPKSAYRYACRKLDMPPRSVLLAHDTTFDAVTLEICEELKGDGWTFTNFPMQRGLLVAVKGE